MSILMQDEENKHYKQSYYYWKIKSDTQQSKTHVVITLAAPPRQLYLWSGLYLYEYLKKNLLKA